MIWRIAARAFMAAAALVAVSKGEARAKDVLDVACQTPAPLHCAGPAQCDAALIGEPGNATEPKTRRKFFLDYPCDLKPGEKVVFILNIHGAGSIGNWQRHYFPALDYKDKYRLVIATPTAAGQGSMGGSGRPGVRMWIADADDAYLQNITQLVIDTFGAKSIKSFWLAGHSQGGGTAHRLVCSDFFKDKVDGLLSLSGGRIGGAEVVPNFGPPLADGTPPPPRPGGFGRTPAVLPTCDFSHIFETGEHELVSFPTASPWADRLHCAGRVRKPDVVDERAGYVYDSARQGFPVWGMKARPGVARVFVYPRCAGARVVADIERMDKGHTEGLEPRITETIVKMMAQAPGGKIRRGASGS
jgi:hypothetical protein